MTEINTTHEMSLLNQEFAKAWKPETENNKHFLKAVTTWDAEAKISFIIAVRYHAQNFDSATVQPESFDMCLYFVKTHRELVSYFVENDVLGKTSFVMKAFIDLDRFACDLTREYTKTKIAGKTVIYRFSEEVQS